MTHCPSEETLRGFLESRLPQPTVEEVIHHVETCSACQDRLEVLTSSPFAFARDSLKPVLKPVGTFASGMVVGERYLLDRKLGEGGMGEVWVAQQLEPVRRAVALKLLKHGSETASVLARFEQERQALALMSHPNIASVYDAGATDALCGNRPFFTMELVEGTPLTAFAHSQHLTVRQRLILFVPICRAVQHAHQKGIIHRDIKPSNILVVPSDRGPVPKLIDFGVAKATEGKLIDSWEQTQRGMVIGTLEYMAPEQADGEQDVDTRADIYSLGVVLYELLTGLLPHAGMGFRRLPIHEFLRILREEVPQKPSSHLLRSVRSGGPAAPNREAERLVRQLRGEPDCIVMKCLEKDRDRRYPTAAALAQDLESYLDGRPVEARRTGTLEKLVRLTRRNPAVAGLLAVILSGFVAAFALVTWSYFRTESARAAEVRLREEAQSRERAERWERYRANLQTVGSALQVHNVSAAREAIQAAPHEHRNWEWHYFQHQLDTAQHVSRGPSGAATILFSADARRVALTYANGPPFVLDIETRKEIGSLPFERDASGCTLSADGKIIAWVRAGHSIVLWDLDAGGERTLDRSSEKIEGKLEFSPDGTRVAAATEDYSVRVWDAASGKELLVLRGHQAPLGRIVFSPDGRRLATAGGMDRTVRVWDARDGRALSVLKGLDRPAALLAFSPKGERLISFDNYPSNSMRMWDSATGTPVSVSREHSNEIWCAAFSPDGKRIATASFDQTIRLWDGTTGQPSLTLRGHHGWVMAVAFSPNGSTLASASQDQTVRLWDASTGTPLATLHGHTANVEALAFAADGKSLVTAAKDGSVRIWDVERAKLDDGLRGHTGFVYGVAFHPDGERLASASWDGTVRLWEATTGRTLGILRHAGENVVTSVAFDSRGHLLASVGYDDTIRLWVVDSLQQIGCIPLKVKEKEARVAFSPRGDLLACGGSDNAIHIWSVSSHSTRLDGKPSIDEVAVLHGHGEMPRDFAFSPDGSWLASLARGPDRSIRIWDLVKKQQIQSLSGSAESFALTVSPDGRALAAGSGDGTVSVWDNSTWKRVAELSQGSTVYGLAYKPDGTRLACACANNTIRLWDVSTGQPVVDLHGHAAYVHQVAFSPDGTRLASASGDFTVRVWDELSQQERAARWAAKVK